MTDKEFLELLMSYKAGTVPLRSVGLALANNQFGHEYVALAGSLVTAAREREKNGESEAIAPEACGIGFRLQPEGV